MSLTSCQFWFSVHIEAALHFVSSGFNAFQIQKCEYLNISLCPPLLSFLNNWKRGRAKDDLTYRPSVFSVFSSISHSAWWHWIAYFAVLLYSLIRRDTTGSFTLIALMILCVFLFSPLCFSLQGKQNNVVIPLYSFSSTRGGWWGL